MKYRILIRSVNINVASLNWYTGPVGSAPWETESEVEALAKYKELLNSHSIENLTLIQTVPVNVEVSTEG